MDVAIIRWPLDRTWRHRLAVLGQPRLLLIDPAEPVPVIDVILEDWLRLPASEGDVEVRREGLARRVHRCALSLAVLDGDGVLRIGGAWVALPEIDQRLVRALLDASAGVVLREALISAGWPAGGGTSANLDVHLTRLRRRLTTVGLALRTIRPHGYRLDPAPVTRELAQLNGDSYQPPDPS